MRTRRAIGIVVSLLGATALFAWMAHSPGIFYAAPGAALALFLLGLATALATGRATRGNLAARALAALTALLSTFALLLRFFSPPRGVIASGTSETVMTPASAIIIGFLALALLTATSRRPRAWIEAQMLAAASGLVALLFLYGELLSAPFFRAHGALPAVPFLESSSALLLALTILLWRGRVGPLSALVRAGRERAVSRRLIIAALVLPAVIARLGLASYRAGLLAPTLALAFGLFLISVLFVLLVWRKAYVYSQSEARNRVALDRLAESEARYRSLFESIPRPMWVYDLETLGFLAVNEAAVEHYGYSRQEFERMSLRDLRPAEDVEALERDVVAGANAGMTLDQLWRHRKKDGTIIDVEINSQRLDFLGRPARLVLAEDVTEKRRLEEAQRRSRELEEQSLRAREASRLKSEFLANMSHELRTPLNSIIGFAELMHSGKLGAVADDHQEYLGDILTSARHLLQLINDILDLSKIEAGKSTFRPELIDLAATVGEARDIVRGLSAGKRIRIETEIDPAIGAVVTDPAKLKQVLYNFLSNAIKFTPEGGTVTVRVNSAGEDGFRVEVEDTGIGIRAADLPKLFTEFEQLEAGADKHYAGTGLGLALTRKIVEAQGGRVGVESQYREGSVFFAVLPRQPRPEEKRTRGGGDRAARLPEPRGPSILVVDDNETDHEWMRGALQAAGYQVDVARTGSEALELCHRRSYAGITLDLLLPDMSGWDLLRGIRSGEENSETPVVVVTVVTEKSAGRGFLLHDFLVKPIRESELVASLERAGVRPGRRPVLVVEDDPAAQRLAGAALGTLGIETMVVASGEDGLAVASRHDPAAVVLDLGLPSMDGFEFLAKFRANPSWNDVPVIVWTIKDLTDEDLARLRQAAQAVVAKGASGASELARQLALYLPHLDRRARASGTQGVSDDDG
ncbi:MAG TPA: response regulator [Thermoanaerobaculia bacterium]|nr:response regulator [Thermoanaerobaculia bacterium]